MATRDAACSCGQLRVTVDGEPVRISVCHCLACQRRTGSAFGFQARFPRDRVQIEGTSREYVRISDEGDSRTFNFCPDCGATVYYLIGSAPDLVAVPVGAFADPSFPAPRVSVWEWRKHPWVTVPAGVEGDSVAPPRRIVTGHDASGRSVVLSDGPNPKTLDVGTAAFHEVWITDRTPAEVTATEPEPTDRPVRTPPPANGVLFRFTEMAPGAESPMHRTETIDIGVVLEGETWLLLDDGSETRVGVGDAVVQRGTNHAWANRSDRPVRMAFVLIDGTITDELLATTGALEFFDQVLD